MEESDASKNYSETKKWIQLKIFVNIEKKNNELTNLLHKLS